MLQSIRLGSWYYASESQISHFNHTQDKVFRELRSQLGTYRQVPKHPRASSFSVPSLCRKHCCHHHCCIWMKREPLAHCRGMQPGHSHVPLLQSPHTQILELQVCLWWVDRHNGPRSLSPLAEPSYGLSTPPSIARRQGQFVEATERW